MIPTLLSYLTVGDSCFFDGHLVVGGWNGICSTRTATERRLSSTLRASTNRTPGARTGHLCTSPVRKRGPRSPTTSEWEGNCCDRKRELLRRTTKHCLIRGVIVEQGPSFFNPRLNVEKASWIQPCCCRMSLGWQHSTKTNGRPRRRFQTRHRKRFAEDEDLERSHCLSTINLNFKC